MTTISDTWKPSPRYLLRKAVVLDIISKLPYRGNLLEIGFGAGDLLRSFSSLGFSCSGIDYSEQARSEFKPGKNSITILSNESELIGKHFEIVAAFEVLEHIDDDQKALAEWHSYLSENGILLLSVPCHQKKWGSVDVWAGHYRRYERADLIKLLETCGFSDITIRCYGFPLTLALDPLLERSHRGAAKKLENQSLDERSKMSGIRRTRRNPIDLLVRNSLLAPFAKIQQLFFPTELGSGYIITARKKPEHGESKYGASHLS